MAEDRQPTSVVEGAAGDVEDEVPVAKSAEDRKAADALSKLDNRGDDEKAGSKEIDQDAVNRAMTGTGGKTQPKKDVNKFKADPADVALLMEQLEIPKAKATEVLKNTSDRWKGQTLPEAIAVLAMQGYIEN